MSIFNKPHLSLTALALAISPVAPTMAQLMLEEVVVTAQKREQSLQDVPISVAAMSGEKINDTGITNLEELTLYTPNVNINKGQAAPNIYVRGVGSGTNAGFEQSVGLYIDGVYSGRGRLAAVPLTMDLARVEILKGPQGILFGKNTIGGAINITTAQPTDEFEAYVDALYEPEHDEQIYNAVISGPITDTVSGRLAVRYDTFGGWWDNEQLNEEGPDNDNIYARGSLRWYPTDTLEIVAKVEHGDFQSDAKAAVIYQSDQPLNFRGEDVFPIVDDSDKAAFDLSDSDDSTTDVFALTVNWDMDFATLTSISAYSAYEFEGIRNSDFAATPGLHRLQEEDYTQYSQELRLVSPGGETLDWIFGGYYQQSELEISKTNTDLDFLLSGPLAVRPLILTEPPEASIFDQDSNSWALFAQGTWSVTDRVRIGAGIRYNEETKELDKQTFAEGAGTRGSSVGQPDLIVRANPANNAIIEDLRSHTFNGLERDEDKFTWSLNTQWDATEDMMVYASVSTGFKGGGYDEAYSGADETIRTGNVFTGEPDGGVLPGPDASILEFDEETVLAYEIGAKMTLADGAAELNMAIFRMEYEDLQVSSLEGDVFKVGNAGESISQGIELDGRWMLTERLTLGASLAYLDAHYDFFNTATCTIPQATDPDNNPGCLREDGSNITGGEVGFQDLKDETLVFAPEWGGNLNLEYIFPVGANLELRTNVDLNYTDEYYSALDLDPNTKHDSYTKVNARVALASVDDTWTVALVGKNLTDEATQVWRNDATLTASNSYFAIPERPRSIAIQARYRF
ncbi:MAG: TonB-dependent receptor [Halioglobus sp.]